MHLILWVSEIAALLMEAHHIHYNPILKNLSESEITYPHSSIRFYFDYG
jgi:hypothetical protein